MKRGAAACLVFIESCHKRQRTSLENVRKENADLSRRNSIFKNENEGLKQYIIEKKFQDQDAQIQQLRSENDVLKAKVALLQATESELVEARKEKASLQEEINRMGTNAKEVERGLTERIAELTEELGKYKTASETEIQLNDLLKERIQELEKTVKKYSSQDVSIEKASLPQFPQRSDNSVNSKSESKCTVKVVPQTKQTVKGIGPPQPLVIPQQKQKQSSVQKNKTKNVPSPSTPSTSPKSKGSSKKSVSSKGFSSTSSPSMFSALDFFAENEMI